MVNLHLVRSFLSAFKIDRLIAERIFQRAGEHHTAARAGLVHDVRKVPVQNIVALITAIPVGVFPCGTELIAAVARFRGTSLHGEGLRNGERGVDSGSATVYFGGGRLPFHWFAAGDKHSE